MEQDGAWAAQNRGASIQIVMTVFLSLSIALVVTRLLVRRYITNGIQVDDWLCLVALLNFILLGAFVYAAVDYGMGRHNKALSQYNEIQAMKYQTLATILYISTMAFVKLSIGFFLLRIAVHRRYIYTLKVSMTILALWTTAIFLFEIFQCSPVEAQWDFSLPNGKCASPAQFVQAAYAFSALAILSDWLYALLPIPMVWNVKMTLQAKCVVIGVLSMGIFASVATLIRVRYLIQLENADDLLYTATDSLIWSIIECGISILASSIVTLRPLLKAMKVKGFNSSGDTRHRHPASSNMAVGPYARTEELNDLSGGGNKSAITKDVSVEYQIGQLDRVSDIGSEEEILTGKNVTITRAWGPRLSAVGQ